MAPMQPRRSRRDDMWRDRWLMLGVVGAALTCLACLTPALLIVLGAIGLACFRCWWASPGSRRTGTDGAGGERHETGFTRRGRGRLGRGRAVLALLPLAPDDHRPRPRERRVHGDDHAVSMDPDSHRGPWCRGGVALYTRERRRCDALACRMAGGRTTLVLLVLASLVVLTAIALDRFPEVTSDLLTRLSDAGGRGAAGHDMKG